MTKKPHYTRTSILKLMLNWCNYAAHTIKYFGVKSKNKKWDLSDSFKHYNMWLRITIPTLSFNFLDA